MNYVIFIIGLLLGIVIGFIESCRNNKEYYREFGGILAEEEKRKYYEALILYHEEYKRLKHILEQELKMNYERQWRER